MFNTSVLYMPLMVAVVSTVLAGVQTYYAARQSTRLKNAQKILHTHIQNLLRESMELASHLIHSPPNDTNMRVGGEKAQQMQKSLWLLMVNMFDLSERDVERMKSDREIGDFEYKLLRSIVLEMKK